MNAGVEVEHVTKTLDYFAVHNVLTMVCVPLHDLIALLLLN